MTVDAVSKAARVTLYDTAGNANPAISVSFSAPQHTIIDSATLGTVVVSGPLTDTQLRATAVPVSGAFFPATQPVSGTVAISGSVAVTGTFFQATQPVSIASPVTVTGTFFQATQPISGAISVSNTVATTQQGGASGLIGDVQVKGVQGINALMSQDFKDSGRVIKVFTASFTAAATEALVSLIPVSDGVAGAANTTFTVTAGKKLRLQTLFLTCFNTTAAIHACQVNLRIINTGAVSVASPIVGTIAVSTAAATATLAASQAQSFPDGLELSGTMQFGISQIGIALAGQTVVLVGYEY